MDTTKEHIRHLSLCSGYEGIGIGLRRVLPNVREIAHVEIEAYAIANLVAKMEANEIHPAPVWTNLKTFPFRKFRGCVDILSGGFPCQPFSVCNSSSRRSTEDPRHLFPYILEGIKQCRPRLIFLENVEGIISSKTGDGESVLQYVLRSLEEVGYRSTAGIFSAVEVGAPHQRKRVFIMGYSTSQCDKQYQAEQQGRHSSGGSGEQSRGDLAYSEHDGRSAGAIRGVTEETGTGNKEGQDETSKPERTGRPESSGDLQRGEQAGLADSKSVGCRGGQDQNGDDRQGIQEQEDKERPVVWGEATGCSGDLRGNRWPSRPGEPQHDWEEPRVVGDSENISGDDSRRRSIAKTPAGKGTLDGSAGGDSGNEPGFMGDPASTGLQEREASEQQQSVPSTKHSDREQEPGQAQPELGGANDGIAFSGVDAVANRVDRLRLLGNGVVPATAELAFTTLFNRLFSQGEQD